MKKLRYSQPLSVQWDKYKENYKKRKESTKQYYQRKNRYLSTYPHLSDEQRQIESFVLDMWGADVTEDLLHLYFVDKTLRDFLERINLPDLDGIIEYIKKNGFSSNPKVVLPNGKPVDIFSEKTAYFHYGIHIPHENKYRGYAFSFQVNHNNEMVVIWAIGKDQGWCPVKKYKEFLKDDSKDAQDIIKILQLAINTIAYMNTFPSCIVDGVPSRAKEQEFYSKKSFLLEISDKVVDSFEMTENGKMVSPHFRRGHFRILKSERYTKMRGKIIFVQETMVNGKAKTVYTADNIEEMENNA